MNAFVRLMSLLVAMMLPALPLAAQQNQEEEETMTEYELIIRTDDIGFCQSINMAIEKVLEQGHVTAISVLVNGPWLNEAVEILERYPDVSVGVHLCLNSEWEEYKWGPVAPVSEVPSLVDAWGKFYGTRQKMMNHRPDPKEVEIELRAQIDLAFRKGLNVSYVDYHMGAAMSTKEFQEIVERLATEYNIGISRYFEESDVKSIYSVPPGEKVDRIVEYLNEIDEPGRYLIVVHPGWDTPEMQAMTDENLSGLPNMSEHRQAEAQMLYDPRFKAAVAEKFTLIGYDDLKERGLHRMKRPFVAKPYEEVVREQALFNPYEEYKTTD